MSAKQEVPPLDVTKIDFPSDKVTVGQMRRLQPESFTQANFVKLRGDEIPIVSAMCLEEMLAQKAYASAAGLPDPYPDDDRLESIRWLYDEYAQYGLSSGVKHTRELVRGFEKAAVQLAKAALGQSR